MSSSERIKELEIDGLNLQKKLIYLILNQKN